MTDDRTRDIPVDPLALAEAVASGAMAQTVAEAALRAARGTDVRAAATDIAEMNDLVTAIRGVRRHAAAFQTDPAAQPADTTQPITPGRVARGDIRLRPGGAGRRPGWAVPGLLAAAAVVVVAVIVGSQLATPRVAATPSPSSPVAIVNPTPSPSPLATASPASSSPSSSLEPTPTPTEAPTPVATGIAGLPSLPSQALADAPGVVYWTLSAADRISIATWEPDGSAGPISFSASTWEDPTVGGVPVLREVIASPDGRHVAFSETYPNSSDKNRLRIFDAQGRVVWTDPHPTGQPELAWSPDGTQLAVGSIPATWKIVTFHGTSAPSVVTRTFDGQAYRILGFSRSGALLYGWDTNGEAEFWQTPFRAGVASGTPVSIDGFSGQADPIGASNGTTPATTVDPVRYGSFASSPIDPVTGRVVDLGGLSGQTLSWELRDSVSAQGTPLGLASFPSLPYLSWTADGSLVVADMADDQYRDETHASPPPRIATIRMVRPEALDTPLAPVFSLPAGTYDRWFYGTRQSTTLIGLGAHLGLDPGYDELVAIDLPTGGSAVFGPADAGLTGLHVAGWITAP